LEVLPLELEFVLASELEVSVVVSTPFESFEEHPSTRSAPRRELVR
jgi:hypothetical protein